MTVHDPVAEDRAALMALYNAELSRWRSDDNWGSEKPLSTWFGVSTDEEESREILKARGKAVPFSRREKRVGSLPVRFKTGGAIVQRREPERRWRVRQWV
ncbi:hypothetical protein [Candidatus Palauibacter sp.]|uniref:hypothetical protein n=1 Tax=Candidatus Palauibacter sp. TaxID=3101350 RepID=UPI003B5C6944